MSQALSAASPSWTKTLGTELKCAGAVIVRREQQLLAVEPVADTALRRCARVHDHHLARRLQSERE